MKDILISEDERYPDYDIELDEKIIEGCKKYLYCAITPMSQSKIDWIIDVCCAYDDVQDYLGRLSDSVIQARRRRANTR